MLLIWIIYISVLIASVAFTVLYKDMLALLLLVIVVALPILLLLCAAITRLLTRVKVEIKDGVINNGEPATMLITVTNHSPFSAPSISIKFKCTNNFLRSTSVCSANVFAKAFSTEVFEFAVGCEHVGQMDITATRAVLHDSFHLFAFSQKVNCSATVTMTPPVFPVSFGVRSNNLTVGESDIFSKHKPGDDPSEVFDIRDYRGGDKLNRIHWKLTVKQNKYMVKDYSFPINESLLLYADLSVGSNDVSLDAVDAYFSALMSLSFEMVNTKKLFSIAWYDDNSNSFKSEKISSAEDVYVALGQIFASHIGEDYPDVLTSSLISKNYLSHICLFTVKSPEQIRESIASFGNKRALYSAVSAQPKSVNANRTDEDNVLIYTVRSESVANDLIDMLL